MFRGRHRFRVRENCQHLILLALVQQTDPEVEDYPRMIDENEHGDEGDSGDGSVSCENIVDDDAMVGEVGLDLVWTILCDRDDAGVRPVRITGGSRTKPSEKRAALNAVSAIDRNEDEERLGLRKIKAWDF